MENKREQYFTPDIEDIRVGYECEELLSNGETVKSILKKDDIWAALNEAEMKIGIRVPYLNKDQIEKEGWKSMDNSNIAFYKDTYRLILLPEYFIHIYNTNPSSVLATLYKGECLDINDLRWICRKIKIN